MTEQEQQLHNRVIEVRESIEGLRLEIELWRRHTSSTGGFLLDELRMVTAALNALVGPPK
jgi:hypothetical protein